MAARTKAEATSAAPSDELVELRYTGTGDYVLGYSTDPEAVTLADPAKAAELIGTGLFAIAAPAAPAQE